jgi:hypothetical protein
VGAWCAGLARNRYLLLGLRLICVPTVYGLLISVLTGLSPFFPAFSASIATARLCISPYIRLKTYLTAGTA